MYFKTITTIITATIIIQSIDVNYYYLISIIVVIITIYKKYMTN